VRAECKKTTFYYQKDWVNMIASTYSDKISVAVSSMQQYYLECASYYCCVSILSADSSWDTYISYAQYSSLPCSVSAFHFSRTSMLMMLLIMLITFFTDLALTDLVFRTDSDKFINSLTFKTVLMNSVWWWEQQKFKDLLLCFFILVQTHFLDCNIVKLCWCLKCYTYRNHW